MIWIINISFIYFGLFGIGILILLAAKMSINRSSKYKIDSVSVVVPFRNESNRITDLLSSINNAIIPEGLTIEFIFVDDHSTDYSYDVIKSQLTKQFKIIKSSKRGKKFAIHEGVELAENKYILTLDADVSFNSDYFEHLAQLEEADLTILPVAMTGKTFFQKLASVEFSFLQLITFSSLNMKMPILANGANLLFSKKAYLEVVDGRSDWEIASGDDVFLLKAIAKNKGTVAGSNLSAHAVQTDAPRSNRELIGQRKRWLSKMAMSFGLMETVGAVLLLLYTLGFIVALFFVQSSSFALLPLGIKLALDLLLIISIKQKGFRVLDVLAVVFFQFWYPIYLLMLLIPSKTKEARWSV